MVTHSPSLHKLGMEIELTEATNIQVFYDDGCMFCRSLAGFMSLRAPVTWKFLPLPPQAAESLRVTLNGETLDNDKAWSYIIENHPSLATYSWMATKIGLQPASVGLARGLVQGIRRSCKACLGKNRHRRSKAL